MARSDREPAAAMQDAGESAYRIVRDALLTGIAVVVPVVITIYVLTVALGLVDTVLTPVVWLLEWIDADQAVSELFVDLLAFTVLLAIIPGIGFLTHFRYGERAIDYLDFVIERVPAERVSDVDMTVEEGLRTVVTTGVATADADATPDRALTASEMERLTGSDVAEQISDDGEGGP